MSLATAIQSRPPLRARVLQIGTKLLGALGKLVNGSLAIVLFCAAWEVLPRYGLVDRVFLPPFSEVVAAWWQLLLSGVLREHVIASATRAASGLALAIVVAVPIGLVIGWDRRIARFLNPLIEILRNTAALALLPVFVLILGIGETSKIAMVLYAASWPILLNTVNAVQTVDPLLVKAARSLGLRSVRLFAKVILPASVPTIFTGIRLAAAHAILVLIAAEMVGARAGLGYLVNTSEFNFQIPQMYAGILTLALLGLLINLALLRVERLLSVWRTQ
ncbi:MAG TPA: ABC transporter permease [Stellaceae bacterium]|jgi:NitT/TauT family transport system permease protein